MPRKYSKRKAAKASNTCCPIIHIECGITKGRKKFVAGEDGRETRRGVHGSWQVVGGGRKICRIRMGSRIWKGLDQRRVDSKMGELKKSLLDKRCQAVVQSEKMHGPVQASGLMGYSSRRRRRR